MWQRNAKILRQVHHCEAKTSDEEPEDVSETPAYRFWFILKDQEPVACLETTGTIHCTNGNSINCAREYKVHHKLWPIIMRVLGDKLP
jgi:hypothetical protein